MTTSTTGISLTQFGKIVGCTYGTAGKLVKRLRQPAISGSRPPHVKYLEEYAIIYAKEGEEALRARIAFHQANARGRIERANEAVRSSE